MRVFMNFGRGDLVDEAILVDALKSNEIGHAVLDVFETEPLPAENELMDTCQIVRYPHMFQVYPESMLKERSLYLKRIWKNG